MTSTVLVPALVALAAAGIPNDLSLYFKSAGKLEARTVRYEGHDLKERLDPRFKAPVFVFEVPATLDLERLLRDLVLTPRGFDGRFSLRRAAAPRGTVYELYAGTIKVDEAWVRVESSSAETLALAVKLPPRNDIGDVGDLESGSAIDGLTYIQDGIVAYETRPAAAGVRLVFDRRAPLAEMTVETLTPVKDSDASLEKIALPRGTFPDQIKVAADGKVWFTQPSDNLLTSYDPATHAFDHVEVGALPDGLGLDRKGNLWFGEYGNKKLGFYDPVAKVHKQFDPDYPNSTPAIPFEDADGIIWITDHQANKLGRFDPATETFTHHDVPTAAAWAVDLTQTSDTSRVWATECYANKLGSVGTASFDFTELALPTSSCPAFFTPVGTTLYVSLWQTGSFLQVDTATGDVVEYKIEGASGFGPIDRAPDGSIVLGGLHDGKVYRFDPATKAVTYAEGVGTLKDGIKAAPDGTVWVTEMGAYIYRLVW